MNLRTRATFWLTIAALLAPATLLTIAALSTWEIPTLPGPLGPPAPLAQILTASAAAVVLFALALAIDTPGRQPDVTTYVQTCPTDPRPGADLDDLTVEQQQRLIALIFSPPGPELRTVQCGRQRPCTHPARRTPRRP